MWHGEINLIRKCCHRRAGRSMTGLVIFLAGFTALLVLVSHFYLFPALEATKAATGQEKQGLTAYARLLLAVLLVVLVTGLILSVRLGRLFFPRATGPTKTKYVDAWGESGRRIPTPPDSSESEK